MKYFWTEAERKRKRTTLCFEFQKGRYKGKCWLDDSLSLHADIFDKAGLYTLFRQAIPNFDYYYSSNIVTKENWQHLLALAHQHGAEKEAIILELSPWVDDCFQTEEVFTICGI